jgi:hypothetical protein
MNGKRWPEVLHRGLVLKSVTADDAGDLAKFSEIDDERCGDESVTIILDEQTVAMNLKCRSPSYIPSYGIMQISTDGNLA